MKLLILVLLITGVVLSSCSHRLVGTWNIQKFETSTHDQEGVSLNNIGSITFKGNGSGVKSLNYSVLGITRDDSLPFTWKVSEHMITIEGENSSLAKSWLQIVDRKNFQQWKSTDGSNEVQILELMRKK